MVIAVAGAVVSRVKVGPAAPVFPAASVSIAVSVCVPSVRLSVRSNPRAVGRRGAEGGRALPHRITTRSGRPAPLNAGFEVGFVARRPGRRCQNPRSLVARPLSIVTDNGDDATLMFPAMSAAVALMLRTPFDNVEVVII